MGSSSVAGGHSPAIPRRNSAPETSEEARVLAVPQALKKDIGLRLGHAAVFDRLVDDHCCVAEADVEDRVVEFARFGGGA
jgi:hypothetical protein